MDPRLAALRDAIDAADAELVRILAKRLEISREIGQLKHELGQPLYVPSREAELIAGRRADAEHAGLPGDLIEDILRRTMRESYQRQKHQGFRRVNPDQRPIVVVGGKGALGQLFVKWFELSGYAVHVIDKDNQNELPTAVSDALLVLIAVPVAQTEDVIANLPELPSDCVLADVTSIKQKPLQAMLARHSGPVIGLHPMFGPSVPTLAKQTILVTPGRDHAASDWLIQQFAIWGVQVHSLTAEQHDKAMSMIQVMRHLSSFVYGYHLSKENPDLEQLVQLSSPIYRLELMMVGRLFAQSGELYADIIQSDQDKLSMVRRYLKRFDDVLKLLETEGREGFVREFEKVALWFGPYAEGFLRESINLLQHTSDSRS
ncbi:bifunctional chorismate mutase/prephenate dehydrogenase [Aliidiomarina sanyensis]|uniref:T-protein n=1 Tax=Aliidiomarina sanyensis TaxID=1249555 RepID=A0A432WNI7_9GAMM|nr:bifunctional chorismate mutase/prephenate dehydrogenase [Aliidiomarina sanyensis]RUO35279.1 bifunctional chorismate mutase/prephenate dehydrogenase [Aliidiomarina sanyensis]